MGDSLLMQLECLLCALGAKLRFVQHVRKILRAVDKMHTLCTEKMCAERSARSESAHYQCSLASHARALTGASYLIAAGCRAGRYWRHHALGKSLRAAELHAAFMALVVLSPMFRTASKPLAVWYSTSWREWWGNRRTAGGTYECVT